MRIVVCILLISIACHPAQATAENTITWYQPDFPPYVILDPSEGRNGIDNQIVGFMIENLPEYTHRFQGATYRRIMEQMKAGINGIITPLFITAERRQFIRYSQPASYLVLPNTIIVKTSRLKHFQPFLRRERVLDLNAAVRSKRILFGISDGRSYSGIIDQIIREHRNSGSFIIRAGLNLSSGLLKMLDFDRIDAWIAFPVELRFTARQCGIDAGAYTILFVADMEPFTPVYFGAPDTPWGHTVLQRIDAILARPGTIGKFLNHYLDWLDSDLHATYRQMAREFYGFDPWASTAPPPGSPSP